MRPIRLTMQYFGSYTERQTIDFELLGTSGLYLITGDTGSGKTTIFDAILYALYGAMSGEYRGRDTLRSSFAKETDKTEVTLRFAFGGKEYEVCRSMDYKRPALRGGGLTNEAGKASLTFDDDTPPISKSSDVDKKIIEILGIDQKQFSQIAMIAQGDFMKLLMADTSARLDIFRKIFKTGPYKTLQEQVRRLFKDEEVKYMTAKTTVQTIVNGAQCAAESAHLALLQQAQDSRTFTSVEQMIAVIEQIVAEDEVALGQLTQAQEAQTAIIHTCTTNLQLIANYEAAAKRLPEQEALQTQLATLQTQQEAALREAQQALPQMEELKRQASLIEGNLGDYQLLDAQRLKHQTAERDIQTQTTAQAQNEAAFGPLAQAKEALLAEQKSLGEPEAEWTKLDAEKKRLEDYQRDLTRLAGVRKQLIEEQNKYLRLDAQAKEAEGLFITKRDLFYAAQAGVLAQTLEEGQPCPVCGATHHPTKAQLTEGAPTKEALDQLEQQAKDQREQATKQAQRCSNGSTYIDSETKRLQEMGWSASDDDLATLPARIQAIETQLKQLTAKVQRKQAIPNELDALEKKRQALEQAKLDIASRLTQAKADSTSAKEQIATLQSKCTYANANEAQKEILRLRQQAMTLQTVIDKAQQALNETIQKRSAVEASIGELRKTLANVVTLNKEDETARKETAEQELKTRLLPLIEALQTRNGNNRSAIRRLGEQATAIRDIEARYQWLKNLDDTLSGQLSGKEKIMLETYVQAMYFERIIRKANLRLLKMTNNQYELRRKQEATNKTQQSGLDLDVIDHHSGSIRTVKGLSGGESFMASLSLALGLSDEIQASAGGIHLDTMFVDEGFGSLDEDSRILARNTLQQLSLEGNRLIGIISHVPELRTIDKQIQVKKNANGESRATIVVP